MNSVNATVLQAAAAGLELAITKALKWSYNGEDLIASLNEKRCIVYIQEINAALLFSVVQSSVLISVDHEQHYLQNPDESDLIELGDNECWISISLFAINKLRENSQLTRLIKDGQLDFAGDMSILQSLSKLFDKIDLDAEQALSNYVGDVAANQIHTTTSEFSIHLKLQFERTVNTLSEMALDEKPIAVRNIMLVNFGDEVRLLRDGVDRLEARLNRLIKKQEETTE